MVQALKAGSRGLMPLDQFKHSPEFRVCTEKQQRWLLSVIESNGDYTAATLAAYGCKTARQAQIFSYAVREVARVKDALNLYLGKTPLDALLDEVIANLRRAEPGSVSAQRLLAQKERLILGLAPVKDEDGSDADPETSRPAPDRRIPPGCRPVRRRTTNELLGYLTPEGERVPIGMIEVSQ
jgi:hypothetical protein